RREVRAALVCPIPCYRLAGKLSGASHSERQSWRRAHSNGPGCGDRGVCGSRAPPCRLRQGTSEERMTKQLETIINEAWENRANINTGSAKSELRQAVEHVI